MKKILLSLLLAGGVQYSFAMQGGFGGGAAAAQGGAVKTTLSAVNKQLIEAAKEGNVESVRTLLASRANVNAQTAQGVTALMIAAQNGHAEVVKALLAGGANVNVQNANDRTALMVAAQDGHTEAVKALLERGANVNTQDADGFTALMIAANKGHAEVVKALLAGGANIETKNAKGKTAIDYATSKTEIIELLKKPMPKPVKGKKASSGSTDLASAGGGIALAGGGAGQNISKTLCTTVAAKILADAGKQDAGTQTEPIQVGSTAQKKLSSSLKSAFSKPSLSGKQSSASQMDCDEARASGGIVVPIARQPNIAPHVGAIQVFYLQTLIAIARANGTGLFGLIQLLNFAANVYFDASEAARLVAGLGFDNSFFAATGNAPITGLNLATLLNNSISSILGPVDASSGFTAEQAAKFQILEAFFNQLP